MKLGGGIDRRSLLFFEMKTEILSVSLFAALALTGCTVDPATGESALFGAIPISAETEEAVLAAAENAAGAAEQSGGLLGIAGVLAGTAIAWWRRRKELASASDADKAKLAALSLIDGIDAVAAKIEATQAADAPWTPTREELLAVIAAAQDRAGTRETVNALRAGTATEKGA